MSGKSRTRQPGSLEGAFAAPTPPKRGEGLSKFLQRPSSPAPTAEQNHPATKSDTESASTRTSPDAATSVPERSGESATPAVTKLAVERSLKAATPPVAKLEPAPGHPQESTSDDIDDVPVYIDATTLKALKAEKGRIGGTYADVAEEALEERLHEVAVLLRTPTKSVGAVPRRRKKPKVRGGIQIQVRFSREQRDWLDSKKDELGAPTRSIIVALALQLKLGTLPD